MILYDGNVIKVPEDREARFRVLNNDTLKDMYDGPVYRRWKAIQATIRLPLTMDEETIEQELAVRFCSPEDTWTVWGDETHRVTSMLQCLVNDPNAIVVEYVGAQTRSCLFVCKAAASKLHLTSKQDPHLLNRFDLIIAHKVGRMSHLDHEMEEMLVRSRFRCTYTIANYHCWCR